MVAKNKLVRNGLFKNVHLFIRVSEIIIQRHNELSDYCISIWKLQV